MIERVWEWRFAAPPEILWPVLADTARFNEAAGLPRYTVSETPLPDGTVRRTGSARKFGIALHWQEGVPEWAAPRSFRHERRFSAGPLRLVRTEIALAPEGEGAALVRYRLSLAARWRWLEPLLRIAVLPRFGRTLDRLFREAAASAISGEQTGFRPPPPDLPASARDRVRARAAAVAEQGYGAVDRLASHLLEASDNDVERMRPRVLARQWQAEPRAVIETCLAAAREGLLTLRWDLLCPRCRGAKAVAKSLDELPRGAHCPSCNIPFDRDFSRNVEVTFEPAVDIRPPGAGTFCLASPVAAGHIKVQRRLAAGAAAAIEADLADGDYRARTVEPGGAGDFAVAHGAVPEVALTGGDPAFGSESRRGLVQAHNRGPHDRTLVIEDRGWAGDALTAHEVTTMQAFRDLFADTVLRPGDEVEIRRVALMFTDIKGSSDLYNRVGDALAYGWVREHFAVLAGAVRRHDGAVVKTIGDAVMAAFANPLDALAAAVEIRDDIAAFNAGLVPPGDFGEVAVIVKLGLHCGPCIAVTLNDRLDYFGRTVNLAARLQGESRGGDIVLSEAMLAEPGMPEALAGLHPTAETARVKDFSQPITLRRVPPKTPLSGRLASRGRGGKI
jgi:class 3 adenylate cyclase